MREPQHSTHCSVQNQRVDEVAIFHKITAAGSATDNGDADGPRTPRPTARRGGRVVLSQADGRARDMRRHSRSARLVYRPFESAVGYLLRRERVSEAATGVRVRAVSSPSCNTVKLKAKALHPPLSAALSEPLSARGARPTVWLHDRANARAARHACARQLCAGASPHLDIRARRAPTTTMEHNNFVQALMALSIAVSQELHALVSLLACYDRHPIELSIALKPAVVLSLTSRTIPSEKMQHGLIMVAKGNRVSNMDPHPASAGMVKIRRVLLKMGATAVRHLHPRMVAQRRVPTVSSRHRLAVNSQPPSKFQRGVHINGGHKRPLTTVPAATPAKVAWKDSLKLINVSVHESRGVSQRSEIDNVEVSLRQIEVACAVHTTQVASPVHLREVLLGQRAACPAERGTLICSSFTAGDGASHAWSKLRWRKRLARNVATMALGVAAVRVGT